MTVGTGTATLNQSKMAQLLGSRYCIESLRSDVTDLQGVLVDVWSRAGPARHASWKFPDRVGADVDMTDMLDTYDYSDDAEQCQLAHVVLIELVIDRLVLLLQSMLRYLEVGSPSTRGALSPSSGRAVSHTSVGLVAKTYFSRLISLQANITELLAENTSMKQRISELVHDLGVGGSDDDDVADVGKMTSADGASGGRTDERVVITPYGISCDASSHSTQTYETAFVPCESCGAVQDSLRAAGAAVAATCAALSLPSAVARVIPAAPAWMSAVEIDRWSGEQTRDLDAVTRHLTQLAETVSPLRAELATQRERSAALQRDLTEEKAVRWDERRQFEAALQRGRDELGGVEQAAGKAAARAQSCVERLEAQLDQVKGQLEEQEQLASRLGKAKKELERQLNEDYTDNTKVQELYANMSSMKAELSDVIDRLEESERVAQKEKAKNKSLNRHSESLQAKQSLLLKRVDDLDQENEELRDARAELQQTRETLEDSLYEVERQRGQLQAELSEQQRLVQMMSEEKNSLASSVAQVRREICELQTQLAEAQEQEKLLVAYPDLNGPVNTDLTGTGDVTRDMQNQVSANNVRIRLLEVENGKLRVSVNKMLQHPAYRPADRSPPGEGRGGITPPRPVPLWQPLASDSRPAAHPDSEPLMVGDGVSTATHVRPAAVARAPEGREVAPSGGFIVGRAVVSGRRGGDSRANQRSRPPSGGSRKLNSTKSDSASVSSIRAYQEMKRNNWQKGSQSTSAVPPGDKTAHHGTESPLTCRQCDKMFKNAADLSLHNFYCVGHI